MAFIAERDPNSSVPRYPDTTDTTTDTKALERINSEVSILQQIIQ
jgi:hypothetical protein